MKEGMENTIRAAHAFGIPYYINPNLIDPKEETGRAGEDHDLDVDDYVKLYRLRNELQGAENMSIDPDQLPPPGGPEHECRVFGLNCGGGLSCFDIDWNGAMYLCNSYRRPCIIRWRKDSCPHGKNSTGSRRNGPGCRNASGAPMKRSARTARSGKQSSANPESNRLNYASEPDTWSGTAYFQ